MSSCSMVKVYAFQVGKSGLITCARKQHFKENYHTLYHFVS